MKALQSTWSIAKGVAEHVEALPKEMPSAKTPVPRELQSTWTCAGNAKAGALIAKGIADTQTYYQGDCRANERITEFASLLPLTPQQ